MRLGPAFKADPQRTQRIRLRDLSFAALGAFVVFPALFAGFGALMMMSLEASDAARTHTLRPIAQFILGIGFSGIYAWVGAPIAVAIGWFASRRGWIGWAVAPLAGAFGGLLFNLVFFAFEPSWIASAFLPFTLMFMSFGALYAVFGWMTLRWLAPEIVVDR